MITQIKNEKRLKDFICKQCQEEGIYCEIDSEILEEEIAIVKVDDYYHSLSFKDKDMPAAVDFLVSVNCFQKNFLLYLIELKNIKSPKGFSIENIYSKFKNTIEDFMNKKFKYIYLNSKYKVKDMRLYFVSDPYMLKDKGISYKVYKRVNPNTTKIDFLLLKKPFIFLGKAYKIKYELPLKPLIRKVH